MSLACMVRITGGGEIKRAIFIEEEQVESLGIATIFSLPRVKSGF